MNGVASLPRKTSNAFEGLSTQYLKLTFYNISNTILYIVFKSFDLEVFHNVFKILRAMAIYTSRISEKLVYYLPMSVFLSFCKIFKRLMFNKMSSILDKYKIISYSHFSFRKKRYIELAVIDVIDYIIMSLDNDSPMFELFTDIS